MAEFKMTKGLSSEVSSIETCANSFNSGYKSISGDNLSSLETAMTYIAQHKEIKEVFELYKGLVLKDVQDLNNMIVEVENMDTTIASKTK